MNKSARFMATLLCVGVILGSKQNALAQTNSGPENIRINQIGFYPKGPKTAVVLYTPTDKFCLVSAKNKKDTVYRGILKPTGIWGF